MVSLKDYIVICESEFDNKSWSHDSKYDYIKSVITDLLNGKEVRTIDAGKYGEYYTIKDFDKSKLEQLLDKLDSDPESTSEEDFNATYIGNLKIKRKFLFRTIEKSQYTGQKSQSNGEIAESLVCYLYNHDNSDNDFNKWVELSTHQLNNKWKESSQKIVNLIYKYWNKKSGYIAIHIDGHNVDKIDEKITNIAKLFKSKKEAAKIVHNNVNDMYVGASKDNWNPADILLVNTNKISEIYDVLNNEIGSGEALNSFLSSSCKDGSIISISLKMVSDEARITSHNVVNNNETADDFANSHIKIATKYDPKTYSGSIYIEATNNDDTTCVIQARSQSGNSNNLSIEANLDKVRMGKGISSIKNALKLKNNEYHAKLNSNDELIAEFKKFGFDIKLNNKLENANPPLYKRTCFIGLLGILQEYYKQNKSTYSPDKFGEFMWMNCTSCPGSYYIIY